MHLPVADARHVSRPVRHGFQVTRRQSDRITHDDAESALDVTRKMLDCNQRHRGVSRQGATALSTVSALPELLAMGVIRIVANLPSSDPIALAEFYRQVFELHIPADMGWITFLANGLKQNIELHTASQGGSNTDLPLISIGVEDLDATEKAVRAAGPQIVYGPVTEAWGLRRFYFRDPAGNLINVVDR